MDAKARINVKEGLVELEGSEEFVSKYLEHFKFLLEKTKDSSSKIVIDPPKVKEEITTPPIARDKNLKEKRTKPAKAKSIEAEKFDYLKDSNVASLQEFFAEKKPGSTTGNIIAVIGYYIQIRKQKGEFTEGNIDFAYKILNLKGRPKHLRQIIINNKNQRDLFEEVEGKESSWKLTRAGEIFVDEQLPSKD